MNGHGNSPAHIGSVSQIYIASAELNYVDGYHAMLRMRPTVEQQDGPWEGFYFALA